MAHRHVVPGIHLPAQYRINDPGSSFRPHPISRPPSAGYATPIPCSQLPRPLSAGRAALRGDGATACRSGVTPAPRTAGRAQSGWSEALSR
jgi:hypothetical protein